MTIIDIGCWERGCACYDSRIPAETVEVVRRDWVSLTDEQIYGMYNEPRSDAEMLEFAREVEAKSKELNT